MHISSPASHNFLEDLGVDEGGGIAEVAAFGDFAE
jgi:hypothetical protein